ncbi:MAG: hypothetical protein EOP05_00465 [Proteobacteria bacterium]|nr:MAG: hypothetical protein EOP05_00465 [Pseudomonadota bacterium]
MLDRFPGSISLALSLFAVPAWLLAGSCFTLFNWDKPATLYWYYYPFWITALVWISLPGLMDIGLFLFVLKDRGLTMPTWDLAAGVLGILTLGVILTTLIRLHTVKFGLQFCNITRLLTTNISSGRSSLKSIADEGPLLLNFPMRCL